MKTLAASLSTLAVLALATLAGCGNGPAADRPPARPAPPAALPPGPETIVPAAPRPSTGGAMATFYIAFSADTGGYLESCG